MTDKPKRPAALAAASAYLGLVFAIQTISVLVLAVGLSSPDRQEDVERQIGWFQGGDMTFDDAVSAYRIVLTVVVVLAAAGLVFAIYTGRGDRPSRVLVTVLAGVFVIVGMSGLIGGGYLPAFLGIMGAVIASQLWTPVVRSHFRELAGKLPLLPAPESVPAQSVAAPQVTQPVAPPPAPYEQTPYEQAPQPYAYPPPVAPGQRPRSVSIAIWTVFSGSLLVGGFSALGLLVLGLVGSDYEQLLEDNQMAADMMRDAGISYDTVYRMSLVMFGVCLALSIGGFVAALLGLARKRSAGVVLFVVTVVTIVASVVWFPIGLPWTAAAIVVVVQLRKPDSRAWFAQT